MLKIRSMGLKKKSPGSIRLQVQFKIKIHHKLVLQNLCVEYRSISKCHTQCMHVWIIFVRWRGEMEFVVGGEFVVGASL